MTAYASYLPKDADQVNNSMLVSFLNCSFEFIAGLAIFSLLFVFTLNPAGSTLSLSFFVIPQGINDLSTFPWITRLFGFLFFFLIVIAGITSSISLIESPASALVDKLKMSRQRALMTVAIPCAIGSILCALPIIVDKGLNGNGTLGLSILDITDHWVFSYSLLIVGLVESIAIGWILGADKLRQALNQHSRWHIGRWFNVSLKYVIPAVLTIVIVSSLWSERGGLYGAGVDMGSFNWLPLFIPIFWLVVSLGFSYYLTNKPYEE